MTNQKEPTMELLWEESTKWEKNKLQNNISQTDRECYHGVLVVDADDDEGRVLLQFLSRSLQ